LTNQHHLQVPHPGHLYKGKENSNVGVLLLPHVTYDLFRKEKDKEKDKACKTGKDISPSTTITVAPHDLMRTQQVHKDRQTTIHPT
jgi:hypothetical protein